MTTDHTATMVAEALRKQLTPNLIDGAKKAIAAGQPEVRIEGTAEPGNAATRYEIVICANPKRDYGTSQFAPTGGPPAGTYRTLVQVTTPCAPRLQILIQQSSPLVDFVRKVLRAYAFSKATATTLTLELP